MPAKDQVVSLKEALTSEHWYPLLRGGVWATRSHTTQMFHAAGMARSQTSSLWINLACLCPSAPVI